jgi:hypothetical protein
VSLSDEHSAPHSFPGRVPRFVWHTAGLAVAAALAYLIWRGYQSPDFLLDLGALRLC